MFENIEKAEEGINRMGFKYDEVVKRPALGVVSGRIKVYDENNKLVKTHEVPHNEVTEQFYILLARLCRAPDEPEGGLTFMAVGSGDPSWDITNPPAPTGTETELVAEIARKPISSITFVDVDGSPSATPTRWIDVLTTFGPGEGTGSIMEIGTFGGDTEINPGAYDELVSVIHQPLKIKGASETFTIELRFQFGA